VRGEVVFFCIIQCLGIAGEASLEGIPTTPDGHCHEEEDHKSHLGPDSPPESLEVKSIAKDVGADNLSSPIKGVVQGSSSDIELGKVDIVKLVGIEPVAGQEHGEEGDNIVVGAEALE